MKAITRYAIPLAAAMLAAGAFADLKVGDPAPPIKVAEWVKGKPVAKLDDGKIHVVEFWATWCGPCRVSIPHLTELAKKFKDKVVFTGVSVWEEQNPKDNSYIKKVKDFVKEMGDTMAYNVAADGKEGTMAKTWMAAAGQNGIPTAFVVDKGKIVWIGHPMGDLEEVLEQVVAGKFDAKAAAEKAAKEKENASEMQKLMEPLQKALAMGDFKAAVVEIDKVIAAKPEMEVNLAPAKFEFLLASDEPAAFAYARKVMDGVGKDNALVLNEIAWMIVDDDTDITKPDFALAVEMAEKGVAVSKRKDAFILDTLGYALFKSGKIDKAIATQEEAVKVAEATPNFPPDTLKELKDRLELFKKKKG